MISVVDPCSGRQKLGFAAFYALHIPACFPPTTLAILPRSAQFLEVERQLLCWRKTRASTMSLLTFARDERVLVFGLAAAAVGVVATMRMLLAHMLDEAEIKQQQPTTQYITQETEDSLKPNTLDTLLAHYNYAIREIAGKIVTDRAVNDSESINYLLWGITRPDYDERLKCLRTLAYITDPRMSSQNLPRQKPRLTHV